MISKEFHASRRKLLAEKMEPNSLAFIFCGNEKQEKGDQCYHFTPYANFYYMTGFEEPKAVLMISTLYGRYRETLFIDHPDETAKRWLGVFYTTESVKEETGIANVEYLEKFESSIPLFTRPGVVEHVYADLGNWEGPEATTPAQQLVHRIHSFNPSIPIHDVFKTIGLMRNVKDEGEIALHRKACEVTEQGVKNVLKHIKPGMHEYEAEAYFDFALKSNNARHAFPTIAASSINACSMHYSKNDRLMEDGDMILFDLGAECGYYAADVSRTYPVNGKFTEQQKTLYNIVLKALEQGIAMSKPGQDKNQIQEYGRKLMAEELMKIGMIEKPEDIYKYYFHGSGHYIGLYAHDVGEEDGILKENSMFTLEPGLYFDDLNLGIRIEDTILITKDGCEVLSGNIPKTVEEIEAFMADR